MYRNIEEAESPFELKTKGHFRQALIAYARHYVDSLENKNSFIADTCFDQMFDVCLLEYLKEGVHFESKANLFEAIENRLADALDIEGSDDSREFKERLGSCKRRLFPRGRSTSAFSVEPKWLLKTAYRESGEQIGR